MLRSVICALILGGGAAACFTESPAACPTGERGCDCTAAASCDAPLVCEPSIDKCIAEDCDAGSELCVCQEGLCLGSLVCDDGLCVSPGGSDGSTGATAASTATGSTTLASSTEDGTDASASSADGTGSSESGAPGACGPCFFDAAQGSACTIARLACAASAKCQSIADCQENGEGNCCAAGTETDRALWNTLATCALDSCARACPDDPYSCA